MGLDLFRLSSFSWVNIGNLYLLRSGQFHPYVLIVLCKSSISVLIPKEQMEEDAVKESEKKTVKRIRVEPEELRVMLALLMQRYAGPEELHILSLLITLNYFHY